ncbi:hypothetical protein Tco_0233526 [Tanacetum coccineum]
MIRTESGRMITKNIDDMTIAEYMEYEAEMKRAEEEEGDSSETLPYQQASNENPGNFTFPCTIGNLKIYGMADVGAGINMMPKSLFEHLKLANLKKTSMVIEMVIDTLEEPDETILLGRPFLATIHAQIDVFRGEILLGEGNEKVKFDMNGEICHSRVPLEKIYMASSIQESESFNSHEMENDDSPALEQRTFHYIEESVDIVDSSSDSQENEVGSHLSENVSRWHVCRPVHISFKVCEEDCGIWPTCNPDLSFCYGYDAIYGKEENVKINNGLVFEIISIVQETDIQEKEQKESQKQTNPSTGRKGTSQVEV